MHSCCGMMDRKMFNSIKHEELKRRYAKPFDFLGNLKGKNAVIETKDKRVIKCQIISYDENINLHLKIDGKDSTLSGQLVDIIYEDKN